MLIIKKKLDVKSETKLDKLWVRILKNMLLPDEY